MGRAVVKPCAQRRTVARSGASVGMDQLGVVRVAKQRLVCAQVKLQFNQPNQPNQPNQQP